MAKQVKKRPPARKKRSRRGTATPDKVKSLNLDRAARTVIKDFRNHSPDQISSASLQASFHAEERKLHPRSRVGQFPVVGIGASAGGIETLSQLLGELPEDTGMAFVLIQHLAPHHESLLPSILARVSQTEVIAAEAEMRVEPNRIYVIPPNVNMGIINGTLRLLPRLEKNHRPIDFFLRCLADDRARLAIGIVLSGADSDGAHGLRAIKAQGGITFAQDPSEAKVDSMPRSAIAAGGVDSVLPVQGIAKELIRLAQHSSTRASEQGEEEPREMAAIFQILRKRTGVDFSGYKRGTISRRLRRRILLQMSPNLPKYLEVLRQSPTEVDALFDDLLINVTSFFRDESMYEVLGQDILPKLLAHHDPDRPFRVWVAGCATGEEVYSLAMCFAETIEKAQLKIRPQIFASDLSAPSLNVARRGIYDPSITADISAERLRRFFKRVPEGYRVIQSLREMCVFARHDLTRDPPYSRMNIVSCRNVLIYLGATKQKSIISMFAYALNPGGQLVLGSSEAPGDSAYFRPSSKLARIYTRNAETHRSRIDVAFTPAAFVAANPPADPAQIGLPTAEFEKRIADRLASHYVPAGLLVGPNLQILQFRGSTGDYLEPAMGHASFNLYKMARPGLDSELRVLISKAERTGRPARKTNVIFGPPKKRRHVHLEIIPIMVDEHTRYYLVMFDDRVEARVEGGPAAKQDAASRAAISELRRELAGTREHLQTIINDQDASNEELQSANEEILSSNEELQSTNEELETAKEELQSTNEELTTVNDELNIRNTQLMTINDDLENLIESVKIPILMVDTEMRIRRYTPSAELSLNLVASDLGRRIRDTRLHLDFVELEAQVAQTIALDQVREVEVKLRGEHRFQLRIRPYRTARKRIDGAVLTFVDLEKLASGFPDAGQVEASAQIFLDGFGEPLALLDNAFRVLRVNARLIALLGRPAGEILGRTFFEAGDGSWGTPVFRALMEEAITRRTSINDYSLGSFVVDVQPLSVDGETRLLVILRRSAAA